MINKINAAPEKVEHNEVFGAWGTPAGLNPEIIDRHKYAELLEFLDCWNDISPDSLGRIAAAVVFRSTRGGSFLLGSAKGDLIMTGTLIGGLPRFNNERWIAERGKHWHVQLTNDVAITRIRVSADVDELRTFNFLSQVFRWIRGGPRVYSGIIRSPLVLPILTEFFSMRQVPEGSRLSPPT